MRRLIQATDAEFGDLVQRSVGRCIRLLAAEMPPGVMPSHAKVGVERHRNGAIVLYVQRECRTLGLPRRVNAWFVAGELVFPTPASLQHWLWADLRPCYLQVRADQALCHARIRAAILRVVAEFGVEVADVDGDVVMHIDASIDVVALGDWALQHAVRAILGPQLCQLATAQGCAKVAVRLLSGLLIAAVVG